MSEAKHSPAAPVPASVREALQEGFMTACSGDGKYQIKIDFETFPKMQAAYSALIAALASLPAPDAAPTLTADFTKALPGGTLDNSTYEQIETALDRADAPMTDKGRFMTLFERIAALGAERDAALSPAAPTREEIAKKLMEFANLRSWELTESEMAEYLRRADAILALKAAPAK